MLTLISESLDNTDTPSDKVADCYINEYAPALALCALSAIGGDMSFEMMKTNCTQHLRDWWQLNIPAGSPANHYESAYWHLLHLLESIEEHQLLGNSYIHHKISSAAAYLLGCGEHQDLMHGVRP